jgi:hypothetical protein
LLFERHNIKSTIAIIPEGLRKAVDVACGKLEKYISNTDRIAAMLLLLQAQVVKEALVSLDTLLVIGVIAC